jgi:sugar lactone lactonase YvrE
VFRKGNSSAELVVPAGAALGEGPVWDERDGTLVWVDIDGRRVHRFAPGRGLETALELEHAVGLAVPRTAGGLVIGLGNALAVLEEGSSRPRVIAEAPASRVPVRINDGCCDAAGRLWAGTMGLGAEAGAGTLYRLDPDHRLHAVLEGVTISNGLDWSPDGTVMYYADSATGRVDRFDFDLETGAIAGRRPFVEVPQDEGEPDGLTVDADGCVWVAIWGAGSVRRYAPSGELVAELGFPVTLVTSCAFGGEDLDELYVTTARYDLDAEELARQPQAGGLFRARLGVRGRPANRFGG